MKSPCIFWQVMTAIAENCSYNCNVNCNNNSLMRNLPETASDAQLYGFCISWSEDPVGGENWSSWSRLVAFISWMEKAGHTDWVNSVLVFSIVSVYISVMDRMTWMTLHFRLMWFHYDFDRGLQHSCLWLLLLFCFYMQDSVCCGG